MTSLLSSCGGSLIRAGNRWRLQTAVWRGVSQTLVTEKHARGPIKVTTLVSRRDLFNGVRGTYISPGNFDQPADFPPYPDPARPDLDIFLAEDGGERIWSNDIQLPFTNTPSMAQRLAKIMLMQIRKQITIVFPGEPFGDRDHGRRCRPAFEHPHGMEQQDFRVRRLDLCSGRRQRRSADPGDRSDPARNRSRLLRLAERRRDDRMVGAANQLAIGLQYPDARPGLCG
jgi:hypothetical protein